MGAERFDRPRVGHFGDGDQIAAPDLDTIDPNLRCDRVEQSLANEGAFEPPRRAIGAARRLVGQPDVANGAIGRHAIGPGQHGGGQVRHRSGVGAHVGALVMKEFVVNAEDASLGIDRRADAMLLLPRMIGGDQVLTAVLDPFHRPAKPQRRRADQDILGIKLAADAEAAADMALVKMNPRRREPEHPGDLIAIPVRHLGGAMQLEYLARAVIAADRAAGLERYAGMAPDAQLERHDRMGVAERRIQVAVFLADIARVGRAAGLEFAGRLIRVQQHRQFLHLQQDLVGDVLGQIRILGKHHRERLAHITHPVGRQHALAVAIEAGDLAQAKIDRRNVGDVCGGPDRMNAGRRAGGGGIDRQQPGVGMRRPHHAHVQLVGKVHIGGKPALAQKQWPILKAGDRPADEFVAIVRHGSRLPFRWRASRSRRRGPP